MQKHKANIIWPEDVKRTKPRERVLSIFEQAEAPLTALEVNALLEKDGESIWLSTIYRILDLFVEKSLLTKMVLWNDQIASYELNRAQHVHYAVCMGCHKMIPMQQCLLAQADLKLAEQGFQVTGHKLEIYGCCQDCNTQNQNA